MYYQVEDYGATISFYIRPENSIDELIERCTNYTLLSILARHTRFVDDDYGLMYGPSNKVLRAYLRELYKDRTVV